MDIKIATTKNHIPLDVRYKVNQGIVNQMRFLRMLEYSLQKISNFIHDTRGIKLSTSTVNYWTNETAKKKQLINNTKQKNKSRALETPTEKKARIKRQGAWRLVNWKRNPKLKLTHEIISANNETRSKRQTVQGLDIEKANKLKPFLFGELEKVK